jgi:hypothetical protein
LKTIFRARKYTRRIINSLGKNGEAFLIGDKITGCGNRQKSCESGLSFGEGASGGKGSFGNPFRCRGMSG